MPAAARPDDELFAKLRLELRRGSLTLAVLAQLRREHYGYSLTRALAAHGLVIEESTLYPLLRRLESQGLLQSDWREEDRRPRRYYRLAEAGRRMLDALLAEWRELGAALERIDEEP